jgi:hypothetical protein
MKISKAVVAKYEVPRIKRSLIGKKKKYYWEILKKFLLKGKVHHIHSITFYISDKKSNPEVQCNPN